MALFYSNNRELYFNCFYQRDADTVSGTFYVLSEKSAHILARAYQATTAICLALIICEICLGFMMPNMSENARDQLVAILFLIGSMVLAPVSLLILTKEKRKIRKGRLLIDKRASLFVYLAIILAPVNYTLMMGLISNIYPMGGYYVLAILFTLVVVAASVYRLHQIFRGRPE